MNYNILIVRCYETEERPIVKVIPCEDKESAQKLKDTIIEGFNATMSDEENENADIFQDENKFYFQSKYVMDDIYVSLEEGNPFKGDDATLSKIMAELEKDSVFYNQG